MLVKVYKNLWLRAIYHAVLLGLVLIHFRLAYIPWTDHMSLHMLTTQYSWNGSYLLVERGQGVIAVQLAPLQLVGGVCYVDASFLNDSDSMPITSRAGRSDWFTVQGAARSCNESSIFEPNTSWEYHVVSPNSLLVNGSSV